MASAQASTSAAVDEQPVAFEQPEGDESHVLYLSNLNERVRIPNLKETLYRLFRNYGSVLDVTAHRNMRMRGQAFVTMESREKAARAVNELQRLPLYGKAMQLSFARRPSDAIVKRKRPAELDEHKKQRLEHKRATRRTNPVALKLKAKHDAARSGGVAAATSAPRKVIAVPDEYQPPNKILFIQNLPEDTTKEALTTLFSGFPNFVEVRLVGGRKGIAFVEYTDEESSGIAKDATHQTRMGSGDADQDKVLRVTFAKA